MNQDPYLAPESATDTSGLTPEAQLNPVSTSKKTGFRLLELLTVIGIIGILIALMIPARRSSGEAPRRSQCKNNLKQIGLALQNYQDLYNALPPAYTVDANGKPLHSWRTLILPWLDQQALYQRIDLSKPWDDPANAEAYKTQISIFHCPSASCPANFATYLAVVDEHGCFLPTQGRRRSEITDKPEETLAVLEVASEQAVHWMSPLDANEELVQDFGPDKKLTHTGGVHALLLDGSVKFLNQDLSATQRRSLITIAGNERLDE